MKQYLGIVLIALLSCQNNADNPGSGHFQEMTKQIRDQHYPNIHSLLIVENGTLIYEEYFAGHDEIWGSSQGVVEHGPNSLHDLRSISKSVVSACMGITIKLGMIRDVQQKILSYFPHIKTDANNYKSEWTIEHFLTMTTGLAWDEDVPYTDPDNDETQMAGSQKPVEYVLNGEVVAEPGTTFEYNGGATQVLAEIIEIATGLPIDHFAQMHLFKPLEITKFEWTRMPASGKCAAASGLRLTSHDLVKIGLLYRAHGEWSTESILPRNWVTKSFEAHITFPSDVEGLTDGYGYQFWTWPGEFNGESFTVVAAIGNGDQRIYWIEEFDILVICTAGNYNNWGIKYDSYAMLKEHILPVVMGNYQIQ